MITKEVYDFFAKLVFDKTGIFYPEKDYYRLDARINNLMSHYNCQTANEIMELFKSSLNPEMETYLVDICTNNETYFFRDSRPFDSLLLLADEIWKQSPLEQLKIWSCASSTGQEPLSIVMTLLEKYPYLNNLKLDIFASDISRKALDKCKGANYTNLEVQRGLPINNLMKYFDNMPDGSWTAKKEVTKYIAYDYFNLLTGNFPSDAYHVIFCRNVLIYQDKENKEKIMKNLFKSLKPGGYLIMGAGESLIGSEVDLHQQTVGNSMFFRKPKQNSKAA